jgi:hypothetical protein
VHDAGDVFVFLDVLVKLNTLDKGGGAVANAGNGYLDYRVKSSVSACIINTLKRYPFKGFSGSFSGLL